MQTAPVSLLASDEASYVSGVELFVEWRGLIPLFATALSVLTRTANASA
jgi:hypothetical protein